MLFPAKINIFGISISNNAEISKIYAEKQVALHSLTFTQTAPNRPHEIAKSRTAKGAVTYRRLKGTAEVAAVQ